MRYLVAIILWLSAGACAHAQTALAKPGQPGWSRTDEGCFVWNPKPQADETVSWSGSCANGRASGSGTKAWTKNGIPGSRYTGAMRDGKEDGQGTLVYPNGNSYEGEWRDGKPNGQGEFTASGVTLDGTWKDGCLKDGLERAWVNVDPASCQ
jgi:hypothetical protein